MLPQKNRLTKKSDFNLVLKKGRKLKEGFLILKFLKNQKNFFRFGIVISKKISKKAIIRNKLKRQIRALLRLKTKNIKNNIDAILIILPGLEKKNFSEIKKTINSLFKKIKLN